MNTVFKAGYQAYLLLGLAAACALPWAGVWLTRRVWQGLGAGRGRSCSCSGSSTRTRASYARTNGFANPPSLDGLKWLRVNNPGDPGAIDWLRGHTRGDAVLLEAFGDDYSAFGHARMSTFTGRPAVLGWAGHEVQWDHPGIADRVDIKTLYTTTDVAVARRLLAPTGSNTSSSARWSTRPTAMPETRSGTSSASACTPRAAPRSGASGRSAARTRAG